MKICLATPAPPHSLKGNRITALRWARLLRQLGHRIEVVQEYTNQRCEILIALHARRSHASIVRFHKLHPDLPLIVALTGTDLYKDIHENTKAQQSLALATRLVILQPMGLRELPSRFHTK